MKRHRLCASILAAAALSLLAAQFSAADPAASLQGFGVVYLHGKGGWPGALNGGILSGLKEEGALVATPEMPWSFHRRYDATYDQAMAEIDAAIGGLKSGGARRIVLIGVSLGANAAIGYAARNPDIAGVVALAPGHLPDVGNMRSFVSDAVARAKALVAEGKGDVPQSFPDMAQGIPLTTTATPSVYLSWFDPDGPAVIPRNVGRASHDGADGSPAGDRLDQWIVSCDLRHSCASERFGYANARAGSACRSGKNLSRFMGPVPSRLPRAGVAFERGGTV